MICEKCGSEVPFGSFFCNVCGAEIHFVSEYNLENDIIDSYIGLTEDSEATKTESIKKKKPVPQDTTAFIHRYRRNLIVGGLIVAVLIVLVTVFSTRFFLSRNSEDDSYEYQMQEALRCFESQDYEMAVAHFDKALSQKEDDPEALNYLALCYENLGEPTAAESIYKSLIELDPSQQRYFEQLVHLYETENEFEKIRALSELSDDPGVLKYLKEFEVPEPSFSHEAGTYDDDLTITILSKEDQIIYYTTDGSDPVTNGLVYTDVIRFKGEGRFLLKAVAQNSINLFSDSVEAEYLIEYPEPDPPKVSLPSGVYVGQQTVSVDIPEGYEAFYTLDGTSPTTHSIPYERVIVLPAPGPYVLTVVYLSDHGKLGESAQFAYLLVDSIP